MSKEGRSGAARADTDTPGPAKNPSEAKKSNKGFDAVVVSVSNVDRPKNSFKVLVLRCPGNPDAGLLKVMGDAKEGDKVKVTVTKA